MSSWYLRAFTWLIPAAGILVALGCAGDPDPSASHPTAAVEESEPTPVATGPGFFEDITPSSGIHFTYHNGEEANEYTILETLGGGVALLDYDQDGLLDIFVTGGGHFGPNHEILGYPNRLYHNEGQGHFRDVTAEVGLDKPLFYSHGCAVGDYDNDGWPDLLVTGYGGMALYHNRHGKFEDVTEAAGLLKGAGLNWGTSAAWADLNGDGYPDLVVCQYVDWSFANNPRCPGLGPDSPVDVCSPLRFKPLPQKLYMNNRNGTFREVAREAGLKLGKGLGVLVVDVNEDGKPDIYIANDTSGNQMYLNKGDGTFDESALYEGVALNEDGKAAGSMGVDAADYDGSGHFSLFVANYTQEAHALYRNRGQGLFEHASSQTGIMSIGLNFVGFGAGFIDYDHRGAEDIVISNGHVIRHPPPPQTQAQRPILLRNSYQPGGPPAPIHFEDVSSKAGPYFQGLHRGRGVALGDMDNDGKIDLVISHCEEPVVVLRNQVVNDHHWLGIELRGQSYRDAVGARLTLEAGGKRLVRAVKGGGSYLSASDRRVVFGLGDTAKVDRLTVQWPSGKTQTWEGGMLGVDHYLLLMEGEKQPRTPGNP
ncbi:MAG: CRTAC1 family protein [Planctomycetes bacterium]|nr:CRTAC1 family protein [Planctomycetota bacterium]